MDSEEWRPFLKQWSEQYIAWHDPGREPPPGPDAAREGWMGFAPAAPAAIAALEERLGLALPPSLRGFLWTTDGEWTAYVFRVGHPDEGFESLADLMDDLYIDFHDCRSPEYG
ncbi:SMI1/KNR4 family protein [Spirillospora sp. NPDC048819]|uniref:SMI1/KNR4 family protein n=1 Tax=Spirillospora sp. NPDC048819 TaxID=3155268 RepID=UPI0033E4C0E8